MGGSYVVGYTREENGDYFLVKTDNGTVYVGLFIDAATVAYWEFYVAATHAVVPLESTVGKFLKLEACAYALAHYKDVTPGLLHAAQRTQIGTFLTP